MLAASLAVLAAAPRAGLADPAQATWTTYLRAGPGLQYAVIDEVESHTAINVADCHDGWCRVEYGRAFGYVEASVVTTQSQTAHKNTAPAAAPVPCFQTRQSGYGIGDKTQFCIR